MSKPPYYDSKELASLRSLIELQPEIKKLTGDIAQYKIILDANAAISDLLHKHNLPHLKQTALEEVTKSSAVALYAPTWLDEEMVSSTIPQVSKKKEIPQEKLLDLWETYKQQIIWDDTFSAPKETDAVSGDKKDLPYVALQQSIGAEAILSSDKGIDKLGGSRVNLQFIIHVRTYARAMTFSVSMRVHGTMIAGLGIGAVIGLIKGISSLASSLPKEVKIALVVAGLIAIIHPKSRAWTMGTLRKMGGLLAEAWPEIENFIDEARRKQQEAEVALTEAQLLVDQNSYHKEYEPKIAPIDFSSLPDKEAAKYIAKLIEKDGLCWVPLTRTPAEGIFHEVQELLCDKMLHLSSPPPDWDHVIIDLNQHPTWISWLKRHAMARYKMKENGALDHELPPLPKNILAKRMEPSA